MSIVTLTPQGGGWTDADIAADAKIAGSKIVTRRSIDIELAATGANIAAITKLLHGVWTASATIVMAKAFITGAATGDRTANVDIQKSTGGGAFATIMSSTIAIDSGTVVRTAVAGAFSNLALVKDDLLQAVVTIGGTTGTQPQGLLLSLTYDELPA